MVSLGAKPETADLEYELPLSAVTGYSTLCQNAGAFWSALKNWNNRVASTGITLGRIAGEKRVARLSVG